MTQAQPLQLIRDSAPGLLTEWLQQQVPLLLHALATSLERPMERSQRVSRSEAMETFRQRHPAFTNAFQRHLVEGMQASGPMRSDLSKLRLDDLELVDEDAAQEDVEVSRFIQQMESAAEWTWREFDALVAATFDDGLIDRRRSPLRSEHVARALWKAARELPLSTSARFELFRGIGPVLADSFTPVLKQFIQALRACGLQPLVARVNRPSTPIGSGYGNQWRNDFGQVSQIDITRPGALEELAHFAGASSAPPPPAPIQGIPGVFHAGQASRPAPSPMVDNGRSASRDPFIAPQVAIPSPSPRDQRWAQVTRPQEDLGGIPKLHLSPDSMIQLDLGAGSTATEPVGLDGDDSRIPRLVHDQARGQPARSERPSDEQITEFIRILFDEILDDPRLHPDVRHDLGLLRPSVLRIAIRDPELLRSHRHPCWLFLNRVASHCIGYEYADDARLVAFLKFFSEVLGDLAYEALPETRLYEAQLERMEAWLHAKQSEQLAADHQKIQKLQRSEQMNHLRAWIDGQLQQQMLRYQRLPGRVREFLTQTWAKVLSQTLLDHGEQSDVASIRLSAVDTLLDSLSPRVMPQERAALIRQLPGLIQTLKEGLHDIQHPPGDTEVFLQHLMQWHTQALKGQAVTDDEEVTPEMIVARMQDEAPAQPDRRMEDVPTSVLDTLGQETVPMQDDSDPELGPKVSVEWLEAQAPGAWIRVFLHGRWTAAQLLWRSDNGQFFMLTSQEAGRSHSLTRRAIEKLCRERLIAPMEARTLIERAVDNLVSGPIPFSDTLA